MPIAEYTGLMDRVGNLKLRPVGGGKTIILTHSADLSVQSGTLFVYDSIQEGQFVDFAGEYHVAAPEEITQWKARRQGSQQPPKPTPSNFEPPADSLKLVLYDEPKKYALVVGTFSMPGRRDLFYNLHIEHFGSYGNQTFVLLNQVYDRTIRDFAKQSHIDPNLVLAIESKPFSEAHISLLQGVLCRRDHPDFKALEEIISDTFRQLAQGK